MRTWSGQHPFTPECLRTAYESAVVGRPDLPSPNDFVAQVLAAVEAGCCPRCSGPLCPPEGSQDIAGGSRVAKCRCVPICPQCSTREGLGPGMDLPPGTLIEFPFWPGDGERERVAFEAALNASLMPFFVNEDGHMVVTDSGEAVRLRPRHTGSGE